MTEQDLKDSNFRPSKRVDMKEIFINLTEYFAK